MAATKCRLKTKAAISRLEVEELAASRQNATLTAAVARLREETYVLRSQLLQHTDCDCKLIQQYLGNRARELADMAAKESEGAAVGAETGRRGSGQGKKRGWDDNDKGAEALGSDENTRSDGGVGDDGGGRPRRTRGGRDHAGRRGRLSRRASVAGRKTLVRGICLMVAPPKGFTTVRSSLR